MSLLEWLAVVFYLLSVFLTVKKNVWFWPTGIIAVSAYMILFYQEKLYADMCLQIVYLLQSIYGWYYWMKGKDSSQPKYIQTLTIIQRVSVAVSVLMLTFILYTVLVYFTDASMPYMDSLATSLSLLAMWLLARRIMENWILWILADIVYIQLFFIKELYLSTGIYIIFLLMSTVGFFKWKKELSANKVFY